MSDAWKRAVRTFLQVFVGVLLSSGIISLIGEDGVIDVQDLSALAKVGVSGFTAGVTAVVALLQNSLEDNTGVPTILKEIKE